MISRAEAAAATRRALLDAASDLLDEGGPEAVTLRAVGARAGVSRGAPYGHFADKEDLLTELAAERWRDLTVVLAGLQESGATPVDRLRGALRAMLDLARRRPHMHALMFTIPARDPRRLAEAATGSQDVFLAIVADVVGPDEARATGALLLSSTHGIAGMERAGQLGSEKWGVTGDELVDRLVHLVTA